MSEAKTKAVQAEAKQEAKAVAKTQETMVYAGPTILGVATHNQFFNNVIMPMMLFALTRFSSLST